MDGYGVGVNVVVSMEAAEVSVEVVNVKAAVLVVVKVVLVVGQRLLERKGIAVVVVEGFDFPLVPIEPGLVGWALRGRGQNGRIPVESAIAIAQAATAARGVD